MSRYRSSALWYGHLNSCYTTLTLSLAYLSLSSARLGVRYKKCLTTGKTVQREKRSRLLIDRYMDMVRQGCLETSAHKFKTGQALGKGLDICCNEGELHPDKTPYRLICGLTRISVYPEHHFSDSMLHFPLPRQC